MKASTWIASFLAKQETPAVFHLSGGMTTFIIDAIATLGVTPIINMRHEQAAGFAAESATRISGRSAVAMGYERSWCVKFNYSNSFKLF